ncbi:MAG: response regulator [Anaerolineales bacterium]|nr:response regulator [Anaerolineales bacterium]
MTTKNLLIVEDEHNLARTLAQALRLGSEGKFKVDLCENAEEAFELVETNDYDLVISDLRLPGQSGLDLLSFIKRKQGETRTILMTGFGSDEVENQATQISDGYLTKPFDMLDLLVMVQKIIQPAGSRKATVEEEANGSGNAKARRILIMEDDVGLRRIYQKALKKTEYELHLAGTVQEAREMLNENEYEIFICDIHMGRERGTDLLTEQSDRLAKIGTQVIMVSAYGQYRTLTEEMGADFFLEKPISLGTLITLISRLMEKGEDEIIEF